MTKEEREEREYISMFADERIAKKSWRNLIGKSLMADASILPTITDGKGNETAQSIIYRQAYDNVLNRLKARGLTRLPMQAEIIIEANIIAPLIKERHRRFITRRVKPYSLTPIAS